ncbi:MAG: hypothetical protein WKH64_09075 [Chloroflexia bacterium]
MQSLGREERFDLCGQTFQVRIVVQPGIESGPARQIYGAKARPAVLDGGEFGLEEHGRLEPVQAPHTFRSLFFKERLQSVEQNEVAVPQRLRGVAQTGPDARQLREPILDIRRIDAHESLSQPAQGHVQVELGPQMVVRVCILMELTEKVGTSGLHGGCTRLITPYTILSLELQR